MHQGVSSEAKGGAVNNSVTEGKCIVDSVGEITVITPVEETVEAKEIPQGRVVGVEEEEKREVGSWVQQQCRL